MHKVQCQTSFLHSLSQVPAIKPRAKMTGRVLTDEGGAVEAVRIIINLKLG